MNEVIIELLENLLGDFKAGNTNLSEKETLEIVKCLNSINTVQKTEYCRTEAYKYLRISRSSFDSKVKEGILPKGKKIAGKGPIWYKRDLDKYIEQNDNKKKNQNSHF